MFWHGYCQSKAKYEVVQFSCKAEALCIWPVVNSGSGTMNLVESWSRNLCPNLNVNRSDLLKFNMKANTHILGTAVSLRTLKIRHGWLEDRITVKEKLHKVPSEITLILEWIQHIGQIFNSLIMNGNMHFKTSVTHPIAKIFREPNYYCVMSINQQIKCSNYLLLGKSKHMRSMGYRN